MNTRNQLRPLDSLFRNTIGFDEIFSSLDRNSNFPPYNLVETDTGHEIELALAGYTKDDITITLDDNVLIIKSKLIKEDANAPTRKYHHQGIAQRKFETRFALTRNHEVTGATFENGMLVLKIERNEEDTSKVITIQ